MERIQKILAAGGIASRRAAEQLITEGRVRVNGRVVTELGTRADPRKDRVEVDGRRVVREQHVYVVLHKPRGVVATMSDPEGRPTVRELLASVGARVFPVGRLDFATSGVLLATNDGEMADGLLHPRKAVPKTYVVKVHGKMEPADVDVWRQGVRLEDGMTLPAEAKILRYEGDKTWIELTIREGRNQQIRRMGEATRFPVMRLARVSFAEIEGEGLRPGHWRHLTREELVALKKTYGVPRSIPALAPTEKAPARRLRAQVPSKTKRPAGAGPRRERDGDRDQERDHRPRGGDERGGRSEGRAGRTTPQRTQERPGSRERTQERPGPRERTQERPGPRERTQERPRPASDRGRGGARGSGAEGRRDRPAKRAPDNHSREATDGPRYGGGSPGRRGYDVTEDWGGGARRGSAGTRDEAATRDEGRPFAFGEGGRGGRTRTTGTSGGPATSRGADRVKTRRG